MLNTEQYGASSLLSPQMADWQGPALYVYNNSTFSQADFLNLSRVGQGSKLSSITATGRFGLGFNCERPCACCDGWLTLSSHAQPSIT